MIIPINISKRLVILLDFIDFEACGNLEGQVCFSKLFLSESRELIESHFISVLFVGIVSLYFGMILEEDPLPIGILELRRIRNGMFGFPGLELGWF